MAEPRRVYLSTIDHVPQFAGRIVIESSFARASANSEDLATENVVNWCRKNGFDAVVGARFFVEFVSYLDEGGYRNYDNFYTLYGTAIRWASELEETYPPDPLEYED